VIYSYNTSQRDALFLNFVLVNNYMFRTDLLSVIRSLNTVFTAIGICRTSYVDCLLARSEWIMHLVGFYCKFFSCSTEKSHSVESAVFDFRAPIYNLISSLCTGHPA
jgi:hypothetical protein